MLIIQILRQLNKNNTKFISTLILILFSLNILLLNFIVDLTEQWNDKTFYIHEL